MIRVLVLARDRATSEGIATGLDAAEDVASAGTARTAAEALTLLDGASARVDVLVVDADQPDGDALRLARELRARDEAPFLVVAGLPPVDATLVRYMEAGADAYLTEELSLSGLLLVLRLLDRGETLVAPATSYLLIQRLHALADLLEASGVDVSAMSDLTSREGEVLELLGHGLSNKEIAERLYIGVGTVKSHVHSILKKLGVRDRDEARKVLILYRSQAASEDAASEDDDAAHSGSTATNQA